MLYPSTAFAETAPCTAARRNSSKAFQQKSRLGREGLSKLQLRASARPVHDRCGGLYDGIEDYYLEENSRVAAWVKNEKAKSRDILKEPLRAKLHTFRTCMCALETAGIDFDPRRPRSRVPVQGEPGRLARDARAAWRNLHSVLLELDAWDKILDGTAERRRLDWDRRRRSMAQARMLHCARLAAYEARQRAAARLLAAGKTVLYGLRWIYLR